MSNPSQCLIHRRILCLLLAFLVGASGCGGKPRKSDAVVVPDLTTPIQIEFGAVFSDGGSVEVDLLGANGERLRLVRPQKLLEEKRTLKYEPGQLYIGGVAAVKDGEGIHCRVPSEAATKIASYLEAAIHEVDPDYDSRWTGRPIGFSGKTGEAAIALDDAKWEAANALYSAKWILQGIKQFEAESAEATPMGSGAKQ